MLLQACLIWNHIAVFLARGNLTAAVRELNILIEKKFGLLRDALILRSTLRTRAGASKGVVCLTHPLQRQITCDCLTFIQTGDYAGAIPDLSCAIRLSAKGSIDRAALHLRRSDCITQV